MKITDLDFLKIYSQLNRFNNKFDERCNVLKEEYANSDSEIKLLDEQIEYLQKMRVKRYEEIKTRAKETVEEELLDEVNETQNLKKNLNSMEEKFKLFSSENKDTLYNLYMEILDYRGFTQDEIFEIDYPINCEGNYKKIWLITTEEIFSKIDTFQKEKNIEKGYVTEKSIEYILGKRPYEILPVLEDGNIISYVSLYSRIEANNCLYPTRCHFSGNVEGNSRLADLLNTFNVKYILNYKIEQDINELSPEDCNFILNNFKSDYGKPTGINIVRKNKTRARGYRKKD